MSNEKETVKRILKGDFRAFELLVKQYEKLVFFVIHRLVQDEHHKQDICQEVFIKVYQSLHKFQFKSKLATWIARIAYLTAVDHVKKNKNNSLTDFPEDIDERYFTDETPEYELIRKDSTAYMNHLIGQLPVQYKSVITLYHLNEFSCAEIEEITEIPEGTVKSYLYRARKLLKEKMENDLKRNDL